MSLYLWLTPAKNHYILPGSVQYCQPRPTLLSPILNQPLSSMVSPFSFLFGEIELSLLETLSKTNAYPNWNFCNSGSC
jgi:hypothetical protein